MELGRLIPPDFDHVAKYPLSAVGAASAAGNPCVFGINWYTNFDHPVQDNGRWFIGRGSFGTYRGGHAICAKPRDRTDPDAWWIFYNQNPAPRCVGFSESRMMSLYNRVKYDAVWLYDEAQKIDGWALPHDGTSVRAGLQVLASQGHKKIGAAAPNVSDGIKAYRWITSVDEVHDVIDMPLSRTLGAIPLLQTWGTGYPHIVWIVDDAVDRLLREGGEIGVVTDR
jgi:hypothetical protein